MLWSLPQCEEAIPVVHVKAGGHLGHSLCSNLSVASEKWFGHLTEVTPALLPTR